MKKFYFLFLFFYLLGHSQKLSHSTTQYFFYENKGQIIDQNGKPNPSVKFLFNSPGLNVQIRKSGFSYDVYETEKRETKKEKLGSKSRIGFKNSPDYQHRQKFHRVDINFENANPNPEIIAEGKSADYENYYNIPGKPEGVTNVFRYQKIRYKNIYPNVDLVFFKPEDTAKSVEYNFEINPGGKISDIQLKFNGAKTSLKNGKLAMSLRFGEMQESIPMSWIENPTSKKNISVQFKNLGNGVFGFNSEINISDKKMVIDPVPTRVWATYYFGDSYHDKIKKIRADNQNNVFVTTCVRYNANVATSGAFQTTGNVLDEYASLTKFNPDGTRNWATLIGNPSTVSISGGYSSIIYDFQINSAGEIYVVGNAVDDLETVPNLITTPGAHKEKVNTSTRPGMIMKFTNSGQRIWGTYFGENFDDIYSISLDKNEDLFIGGKAYSKTGIVTGQAYIKTPGSWENGFFAKFSKDGRQLYGSYITGAVYHTAVDSQNNYIISGWVVNFWDSNEGTAGTHQPSIIGDFNSLIIKFDSNFNKKWGTYYGGKLTNPVSGQNDKSNFLFGIGTDSNNNIYIAGNTTADSHIATPGAHKSTFGGNDSDVFIAKLDENGRRIWGTYYGANTGFPDTVLDLNVRENGSLYISGSTRNSTDISTPNAYMPYRGTFDGYFSKFDSSGNLVWGSYYSTSYSIFYKNNFIYLFGEKKDIRATPGTFMTNDVYGASYLVSKFKDCTADVSASSTPTVCPGSEIKLQASGGTGYQWTGPNGFTSTEQNPTITNATAAMSGTYSVVITGTGDCDGTYNVVVKVEDKTPPVPNVSNLPQLNGDCKFSLPNPPTANDSCDGQITATTSSNFNFSLPGTYTVVWEYKDKSGNVTTQNQTVVIQNIALPTAASAQTFCAINNPKVSDISVTGSNLKFYNNAGTVLNISEVLMDGYTYYISQTINGCESSKIPVTVKINSTPKPSETAPQNFCTASNATLQNLNVSGTALKFYDALGNVLPNTTLLSDAQTYYITQTLNSCESEKMAVTVSVNNGNLPANSFSETVCNDTTANTKTVNLNDYKAKIITGNYDFTYNGKPLPTAYQLQVGRNHFKIKVSNSQGCYKEVDLILTLNPKPELTLPATAEFCQGQFATLDAGSGFSSYLWSTGKTTQNIKIDKEGTYTVKVGNNFGCTSEASIVVKKSVLAAIESIDIVNNDATVKMSASGDFLYSLDQTSWVENNHFNNLANGNYTVYVKTKGGCIIGEKNFSIFDVPNTFTPDGDGINDIWAVSGLENYPGSEVLIFDRFGKLIFTTKITNNSFSWNGKTSGRPLPTGSYWYYINISDGRKLSGWLMLKNRN